MPAIALSAAVVICLLSVLLTMFLWRKQNVASRTKTTSPSGDPSKALESASDADTASGDEKDLITSLDDTRQIKRGVGFVVCGWTVRRVERDVEEVQQSSGSCFSVSPDGYLVTSKHLIEEIAREKRLQPESRIKEYCDLRSADLAKSLREQGEKADKKKLNQTPSLYNPANFQAIDPKIWVFFGSKEEMYEARIVPVESRDVSILKIDRQTGPYFRLADMSRMPKQRMKVYALGFPGVVRKAPAVDEGPQLGQQTPKKVERIQDQFSAAELGYSSTNGEVSRIVNETQSGPRIEHTADLKPGNSGGPLVTEDATVVGINIWAGTGESDMTHAYYSSATPQLRDEILAAIRKDRESSSR